MRLVPEDNYGRIGFFKSHLGPWMERALQIGTTPEEVALLQAAFDEAQDALAAHGRAQNAARSATMRMNQAMERMCRRGASIVGQIRSAARTGGVEVYTLARIPPPESASPLAPPGDPTGYTTDIDQVGWLTLRWTCKNPRGSCGTMYHVCRQLDGQGPFEHLVTVGKKVFVDRTIPLGTKMAIYSVQAIRSTRSGTATRHSVYFGSIVSEAEASKAYKARDAA